MFLIKVNHENFLISSSILKASTHMKSATRVAHLALAHSNKSCMSNITFLIKWVIISPVPENQNELSALSIH